MRKDWKYMKLFLSFFWIIFKFFIDFFWLIFVTIWGLVAYTDNGQRTSRLDGQFCPFFVRQLSAKFINCPLSVEFRLENYQSKKKLILNIRLKFLKVINFTILIFLKKSLFFNLFNIFCILQIIFFKIVW